MKENSNKLIAFNSLIMNFKLVVTLLGGLLSARFALQALGENDFGLFSVVGGVISFVALINTSMLAASNRGIAYAIGKGKEEKIAETFNVNVVIHSCIAIFTMIFAIPVGHWYIGQYINYGGDISNIKMVYDISVTSAAISFLGVPYNGLLIAKEKFLVFCMTDVMSQLLKIPVTYALLFYTGDRLLVYTLFMASLTIYPTIVYITYCIKKYHRITKWRFVHDWQLYKSVLNFAVWTGYGAFAFILKAQGTALIVNAFFNTVMNAALGLASRINSIFLSFGENVRRPMSPQITKNYASSNLERCEYLVISSSKISFIVILLAGVPFFSEGDYLLTLWLGEGNVPLYTGLFIKLLIIDALIASLNSGITEIVFATGRIKNYQLITNTIIILAVISGYYVLKAGYPVYYFQINLIVFSVILLVTRQVALYRIVKFNNKKVIKKSYLPCICCGIVTAFLCLIHLSHSFINIIVIEILVVAIVFYIAFDKKERMKILGVIQRQIMKQTTKYRL